MESSTRLSGPATLTPGQTLAIAIVSSALLHLLLNALLNALRAGGFAEFPWGRTEYAIRDVVASLLVPLATGWWVGERGHRVGAAVGFGGSVTSDLWFTLPQLIGGNAAVIANILLVGATQAVFGSFAGAVGTSMPGAGRRQSGKVSSTALPANRARSSWLTLSYFTLGLPSCAWLGLRVAEVLTLSTSNFEGARGIATMLVWPGVGFVLAIVLVFGYPFVARSGAVMRWASMAFAVLAVLSVYEFWHYI